MEGKEFSSYIKRKKLTDVRVGTKKFSNLQILRNKFSKKYTKSCFSTVVEKFFKNHKGNLIQENHEVKAQLNRRPLYRVMNPDWSKSEHRIYFKL